MSAARFPSRPSPVGYSGKPLAQKLGLKPAMRARLHGVPAEYREWCDLDEAGIEIVAANARAFDFVHVFAVERATLERELKRIVPRLAATGMLWISWPKKSARVATDLSEDVLRAVGLPLGLVDVKVCAVSEVWSGLKFVWRVERRAALSRRKKS
jgi:hypothetical protein